MQPQRCASFIGFPVYCLAGSAVAGTTEILRHAQDDSPDLGVGAGGRLPRKLSGLPASGLRRGGPPRPTDDGICEEGVAGRTVRARLGFGLTDGGRKPKLRFSESREAL